MKPNRMRRCTAIAAIFGLLTTCVPIALALESQVIANPKSVAGGLVVCVEPNAARIGAEAMRDGGNAVDAAIATAFALAVTHPEAGNIGGGGFMLVWLKTGEAFGVDYREMAPALATPSMFLGPDGKVDKAKADIGWLTVGVPGTPMGLWTAHQKAGKLPWKRLVEPAVALARDGFLVDSYLHRGLSRQEKIFGRMKEPARVYLVSGKAPKVGDRLKLPELAHSLALLAEHGPDGFYRGETAAKLEAAMITNGGLVCKTDLANYQAKIRKPVFGKFHEFDIVSMPPPSSGGIAVIEMLNILESLDLAKHGHNSVASLHRITEAMRRAYLDRARFLGDPDFISVPVEKLLSKSHAIKVASEINFDRAGNSAKLGKDILDPSVSEKGQTTHFSVVDPEGNVVANTFTLEDSYGAKVVAPGTGFLLNNEMHDFNVWPGHTTTDGKIGTPANLVSPGKRMLSSMTPTIVLLAGKPFLVTGSPGGRTIPNTVLQVVLNVCEFKMDVQSAVDALRIHHQWMPDRIQFERKAADDTVNGLSAMGHEVLRKDHQGDSHSILIDPTTGERRPGIDHRLRGAAAGY